MSAANWPVFRNTHVAERFKTYFLRGMAVLLPTVLTIALLVLGYQFIRDNISSYIALGLRELLTRVTSEAWVDKNLDHYWMGFALNVAGFLVALLAVLVVGALLASVVGKTLWRMIENFIMNTPILRQVYPYIKQITDFLLTREQQKQLFSRVVAVEYPRKGIWSLGFVTGSGLERVVDNVKKEFLTVLIPTSPTPFTGFVIMVPKKLTIELGMSVEEALRFTVSGGVITPTGRQTIALPKPESDSEQ
jgi:uncharacterized membrane protein